MEKKERIISAAVSAALGFMLIIMKGGVINAAITVLGAAALVFAVVDFINKRTESGIVKAVVGVCVLVFGWMFVDLAFYIFAAAIILMGLLQISSLHKYLPVNLAAKEKFYAYLKPVLSVLAGVFLLFNFGGVVDWIFVLSGILLVADGIFEVIDLIKNR